jgi:cyclic beta-1,2-glucan synthetase
MAAVASPAGMSAVWSRRSSPVPGHRESFSVDYRYGATLYHVMVHNPHGVQRGVKRVTLDGENVRDGVIRLSEGGGSHQVLVWLG